MSIDLDDCSLSSNSYINPKKFNNLILVKSSSIYKTAQLSVI